MEKKYRENQYKFWQELLNLGNKPKRKDRLSTDLIDRYVNSETFSTGVDEDIFNRAYEGSKRARKSKAKTRTIIIIVVALLVISAAGFYFGNMYIQEKARAEEESQRISMQETIQASFEKTETAIALATAENIYEATAEITEGTDIDNENESDPADNIDVTSMPDAAEIADETTLDQDVSSATEPEEESIVEVQTTPIPMDHWLNGEPLLLEGNCSISGQCEWVSNSFEPNTLYAVYLPVPETDSVGVILPSVNVSTQSSLNVTQTYAINECDIDFCFIGLYSTDDIGQFTLQAKLKYSSMPKIKKDVDLFVFPVYTDQYIETNKLLVKDVLQIVEADDGNYFIQIDDYLIGKAVYSFPITKAEKLILIKNNEDSQDIKLYVVISAVNGQQSLNYLVNLEYTAWNKSYSLSKLFQSSELSQLSELPEGSYFLLTSSKPVDLSGTYLIVTTTN